MAREAVRRALRLVLTGRTALLITHSLAEAAEADRVVVLRHGRVVETGSPRELDAQAGWFHEALAAEQASAEPFVESPREA